MRIPRLAVIALSALSAGLLVGAWTNQAAADDIDGRASVVAERLVPQCELDAVSLSIVDEKLALSLAVETHIQIELARFALSGIHQDDLKRLTERKLLGYRQMLATLEELTGGRASKALLRASGKTETTEKVASTLPPSAPAAAPRAARPGRKSSIGDIVQNATAQAILRIRLEIAEAYAHLLRAELEAAPPGEFDRRYLGIESYNQMQVLAMLRVFEQHASPDFGRIIHLATVAAEGHVTDGRQVAELIKSGTPISPVEAPRVVNTADNTSP